MGKKTLAERKMVSVRFLLVSLLVLALSLPCEAAKSNKKLFAKNAATQKAAENMNKLWTAVGGAEGLAGKALKYLDNQVDNVVETVSPGEKDVLDWWPYGKVGATRK